MPLLFAGLILAILTGQANAGGIRFATFNASMSRDAEGALAVALRDGDEPQIAKVARIIRAVDPDVILINEFDHGAGRDRTFVRNYLDDTYPFSFIAPPNTGLATGLDLDGDGIAGSEAGTLELAKDAHGFGMFEGQYGMVVLSKHEIVLEEVRTFRTFRWNDMPGARLPVKPDGAPFYSDQALEILRLSSKSHWDVPVRIDGAIVHFLVCHPTPPVFDGAEDRNGARNADEIRFWADYIAGAEYVHDDAGLKGGLSDEAYFRHRRRHERRPDGWGIRAGSNPATPRTPVDQRLRDASKRWRSGRSGSPMRSEFHPNRRSPLRHRGLQRRGARQSARGLRAPLGRIEDCRCRCVLAS